ncbi:N-acetylgalactosaminyltransferase 7-like [Clytia hemisphaerica]|uniref:N-acetylgalactosaminyltransferase 7-like n=1 Tax=Clytia hemisphaerica TaxID=252671 RepID=UPI0034D4E8CF
MRTVYITWRRVLPAVCFVLFIIILCIEYRSTTVEPHDLIVRKSNHFPGQLTMKQKTTFNEDGQFGNFEVDEKRRKGPGEAGKPHRLRPDQETEENRLKGVYGFNQLVSDEISLDRSVPDMREKECKHWNYPIDLPTASVIFIFHNEGWSTLLRSVHSVINRTPAQFLHEIVLVDDKSEMQHLHEPLDEELQKPFYQSKVKVVRNNEREGLIRARNNGAVIASGEVLVFLDAHIEVGLNWLPPLLGPIYENPRTLSVPIIDGIRWDDFALYSNYGNGYSRGLFEWGMLYKEGPLPEKEKNKRQRKSEPFDSPTHAGGLFAIRRDWFKELGWYDPGLLIWGGENYELAFKLWQCGGRSVWVPCSRIGHVYRGHSCSSCHSGDLGKKWGNYPLALRNYKRLIEVWFDDKYKEFFYTREPLARFIDHGDISEQLALKKRMNCKSFTWFMKEVAYDVLFKFPELPPNKHWGEIKNAENGQCIDTQNHAPPGEIGTSGCHGLGGPQLFRLNTKGQLTSGEWCIVHAPNFQKGHKEFHLIVSRCKYGSVNGPWSYDEETLFLKNNEENKCVAVDSVTRKLVMERCNHQKINQQWKFSEIKPHRKTNF